MEMTVINWTGDALKVIDHVNGVYATDRETLAECLSRAFVRGEDRLKGDGYELAFRTRLRDSGWEYAAFVGPVKAETRKPTIDSAGTADELLTALAAIDPDNRATALAGRGVKILRDAADLCGVSYADTMTKRQAITAITENF